MNDQDDRDGAVQGKVIDLMSYAKQIPARKRRTPPPAGSLVQSGSGNIQAGRDVTIHAERVVMRAPAVQTGVGTIDARQKARLKELVGHWIDSRKAVRREEMHFSAAWSAFNKAQRVNSYHEIAAADFKVAEAWLLKQIAIVNGMPSARKRVSGWRNGRIKAIQARCNELDIQDARRSYMRAAFDGRTSLVDLSDEEVEQVYRWVMARPA